MNERNPRDEPSTEEILESIRQAVAEGAAAGEKPSPEVDEGEPEILDLTQEIREDGSVVDTETGETVTGAAADRSRPGLLGENAEAASAAAFAALAESVAELKSLHEERGGKTIEEAAKDQGLAGRKPSRGRRAPCPAGDRAYVPPGRKHRRPLSRIRIL